MAQKEGYRARAVYKLSEIDEQDHLIQAGMTVVDLGSAPGSWSQYVRNRLTELGKNNPKIEFLLNTEVTDVLGQDKVEALQLRNTKTGDVTKREFTGLFVAIGHSPRSELLAGQVSLDGEGYVQVEGRSTRTNLKGVFACGDLVDHTYRQAITAAGSGCQAALDAERFLNH